MFCFISLSKLRRTHDDREHVYRDRDHVYYDRDHYNTGYNGYDVRHKDPYVGYDVRHKARRPPPPPPTPPGSGLKHYDHNRDIGM